MTLKFHKEQNLTKIENPVVKEKLWQLSFRRLYESDLFIPIEKNKKINVSAYFENLEKFHLEMGSGWGEVAIALAKMHPDTGFVLLEKKMQRITHTIKMIKENNIKNIRILPSDFQHFLAEMFLPAQFDAVILNFPDPWPKRKHWKNRTVNRNFLNVLANLLKANGIFHFATDYGPYARKVIRLFRGNPAFSFAQEYSLTRDNIPVSRFEEERKKITPRLYYLERKLNPK